VNKLRYLLLLLLVSCSAEIPDTIYWADRIKVEAKEFCSCRGGIDYLEFNTLNLHLKCKDGFTLDGVDTRDYYIVGCLK
jgi:hypothetical protein